MTAKYEFLKSKGWYQWYNNNYWCHEQFTVNGQDPTRRGLTTEDAYLFETDEPTKQKILEGMSIFFSCEKALSNLGVKK